MLKNRPETALHFQAGITTEFLQEAQSYFGTRSRGKDLTFDVCQV